MQTVDNLYCSTIEVQYYTLDELSDYEKDTFKDML